MAGRRVIFLDIDGVLAPIKRWDRYGDIDRTCVDALNAIVAGGNADVVVSSTWRYGKTVTELQEILGAQGFAGRVVDMTPTHLPHNDRTDEILTWLADNAVDGFVVIDDHVVNGVLRAHLVLTEPARGLRAADVERAIEALLRAPAAR